MSNTNNSIRLKLTNYLLERLDEIDANYKTASQKSSQWRKAANKVKKELRDNLAPNTVHNYTTLINNAVKETGRKHHALTSTAMRSGYLSKAIKDLPEFESELKAVAAMPATTIDLGKAKLLKQVRELGKGELRSRAITVVDGLLTNHPIIEMLGKSKEERLDRTEDQEKSLDQKSVKVKVYNIDHVLALATDLLESDSYTALAWAIALLTGRRSTEVIYHAEFEVIDSKTVLFTGQSKKRMGVVSESYPIPVLADSAVIIQALNRLRNMEEVALFKQGTGQLDGKTVKFSELDKLRLNRAINQRTSTALNDRAKRLMEDDSEVFKNTRNIYARYAWEVARHESDRWNGYNEDAFLKAVLGHVSPKEIKHYRQVEFKHDADSSWLKIPEPIEKKEENNEPKELVKQNRRAMAGFADMTKAINDYPDKFIQTPQRRVNIEKVRELHHQLSVWASENPTLEITQTVVTKNKGNTADSGTGTMNLTANRYTFQAWVIVAGNERVNAYNKGKSKA